MLSCFAWLFLLTKLLDVLFHLLFFLPYSPSRYFNSLPLYFFYRVFPQLPAFLFLQSNVQSVNIPMIRISDFPDVSIQETRRFRYPTSFGRPGFFCHRLAVSTSCEALLFLPLTPNNETP